MAERINERLLGAMTPDRPAPSATSAPVIPPENAADSQVTSPEEIEGLHIIRGILRDVVSPRRIVMRDAQSYCAILLDDNNRKPVCRLRFNNSSRLFLGLFNENKEEERVAINGLDDLYGFEARLKGAVSAYLLTEQPT